MKLKGIVEEDFINYKKPSLFLIFPNCDFKCERESGIKCCLNSSLYNQAIVEVDKNDLIRRYLNNNITESIVMGGLEPFEDKSFYIDIVPFIDSLRKDYRCNDDIVIYTGFYKQEISEKLKVLSEYTNIIIKFGRFIPKQEKHFDFILGVYLSSDNQYGEKIS